MSHDEMRDGSRPDPALVSCFWCERLHPGKHPLSVCGPCASRYATMAMLEMSGSYPLTRQGVDAVLSQKSAGNYALGYLEDGDFRVFYVGRSDSDVKQSLHDWVGMPSRCERPASVSIAPWQLGPGCSSRSERPASDHVAWGDEYTRFAYSYSPSAEQAYAQEWRNYDAFGGDHELDNAIEPVALAS